MANKRAADASYRILLTNWQLIERAGTECVIRDLATGLRRRGHRPIVYSPALGEIARDIQKLGIPVIEDLRKLAEPPTVIHGHHLIPTAEAIIHFPDTPALFACHAWKFWVERPPKLPQLLAYTAVSETTRDRLVHTEGIAPDKVHIVHNAVDLARLPRTRRRLARRPRKAVCFAGSKAHVPVLRAACRKLGLEFAVLGRAGDRIVADPEKVLAGCDLVFATGRSAIEGLCCGAAVVVCDENGFGGLVTTQSFDRFKELNFALRSLTGPNEVGALVQAVEAFDREDAEQVAERARRELSLDVQLDLLIDIYGDIITRWRQEAEAKRAAQAFRPALLDFLHDTLPRMPYDERWPWQREQKRLLAERTRLDRECAELRQEAGELRAENAALRKRTTELDRRVDDLVNSTSWRLTAPARWLRRSLSPQKGK